jgi:DNA (cytosine-5)-methyltransferase 1
MRRPILLDLFCKAGGCSVGYHRAGFDVVGCDIEEQPNYPFPFVRADALRPPFDLRGFDAVHASPPCQGYTVAASIHGSAGRHPDLVGPTRRALEAAGVPWVIENVPGSPLGRNSITLCGLMFGLRVIRHRVFESSLVLFAPPHRRHPRHLSTGTLTGKKGGRGNGYSTGEHGLVCVAGNNFVREAAASAMGIDWPMSRRELANAIPPAYTFWIGKQLIRALEEDPCGSNP